MLNVHRERPFDIILLDVMMPLLNGIEAAREIRQSDPKVKIVFLTISADYAVESYTVKADNYLLKPVNSQKLLQCLFELCEDIQRRARYIVVRSTAGLHRIMIQDIESVEAQNKQVALTMLDGSMLKVAEPLYSLKDKLLFEDGFYKCHRSYVVNLYHIETYTPKEIQMQSGRWIPISRNTQKEFESAYFSVMFGNIGGDGA